MYIALVVLIFIVLFAAIYFYAAKNYLGEHEPFYSGNYAVASPRPGEDVTVLSYNISYGRNIEQALHDIRKLKSPETPDIFLLQEMDEVGVERLARELQMNYVYFPAAVEPKYRRNFGNAVLSRWPIVGSRKLILPHISLSDRMKRVATRATIRMEKTEIVAYSIHTEPVFILPKFKENQSFAILEDAGSEAEFVIIGGDFNSFTEAAAEKLEKRYQQAGFVRASKGSGDTFARFGLKMATDQIFVKGFVVKAAGKMAEAEASDHLPVWATLTPRNGYKVNGDSD